MIQFDVESAAAQVLLGNGAQHFGFVRTADEGLGDQFPGVNRSAAREAMVARHQDFLRCPPNPQTVSQAAYRQYSDAMAARLSAERLSLPR